MEGEVLVASITYFNSEDYPIKIVGDFPSLNGFEVFPGSAINLKVEVPSGLKIYKQNLKEGGKFTKIYLGLCDIEC